LGVGAGFFSGPRSFGGFLTGSGLTFTSLVWQTRHTIVEQN
jgi:hypothetical protein